MAYVAPQNKLAGLASALSGTAKGMSDFQQVQMRQNQMAEQKRQFDENLSLGFKRLDEQIRQFDQSDATTRELQQLSRELQEREGIAQRATQVKTTGMVVGQRRRAHEESLEQARLIDERTFQAQSGLALLDSIGYAQLGPQPGLVAGETPEQHAEKIAKWNQGRNQLAIDYATAANTSRDPITEDDVRKAGLYVDNAADLRKEFARQQYVKASARAMARGLPGAGASIEGMTGGAKILYSGKTRHMKTGEGGLGKNTRLLQDGWLDSWANSTKHSGAMYNDPRMGQSANALKLRIQEVRELSSKDSLEAAGKMKRLDSDIRNSAINFPGLSERDIANVREALDTELIGLDMLKNPGIGYVELDTVDLSQEPTQQSQQQTDNQAQVQQMMDEGMSRVDANRSIIDQVNQSVTVVREPSLGAIRSQNPNLSVMDAMAILREQQKEWDAGAPARQRAENEAYNEEFRQGMVDWRDEYVEAVMD